jgi:ABC-type amino acid transport substrate-binding protein
MGSRPGGATMGEMGDLQKAILVRATAGRRLAARPLCALAMLLAVAGGCGIPRDPDGTYDRVRGATMRAGVSEHPPWTSLASGKPAGIEVDLLEDFAASLSATIRWHRGSEAPLVEALNDGRLDVIIGGFRESTPWNSHAAATQPYVESGGEKYVMLVRQGENRWLIKLDRYLAQRKADTQRRLDRQFTP